MTTCGPSPVRYCTSPKTPLGCTRWLYGYRLPAGLFGLHEQAEIALRVLPRLWPFWDAVQASSLGWSGIRLRNALPRTVQ
ncbi:DUF6886 family protein [Lentzea sp. NPDC051213]|uniref:DUF6886 family protein n=1 Tax=Lentzea sp. NPDC051213 TaxID=3364126 RepID=UPI0037957CC4